MMQEENMLYVPTFLLNRLLDSGNQFCGKMSPCHDKEDQESPDLSVDAAKKSEMWQESTQHACVNVPSIQRCIAQSKKDMWCNQVYKMMPGTKVHVLVQISD